MMAALKQKNKDQQRALRQTDESTGPAFAAPIIQQSLPAWQKSDNERLADFNSGQYRLMPGKPSSVRSGLS